YYTELKDGDGNEVLAEDGRKVYRPRNLYIWIPERAIGRGHQKQISDGPQSIENHSPEQYPPELRYQQDLTTATTSLALLDEVLDEQKAFQDSDGLISFVNLASSFVTDSHEFKTGQAVCDKVSNFFATLRQSVYSFLLNNPAKVLKGDINPTSQWDLAVTHYMQFLLTQAGGLTNYVVTSENYSTTQVLTEFSTDFIKLLFDSATVPKNIIGGVVSFIQGVGKSLRTSWDDRARHYQINLLGQCHEAVPTDETGETYIYFPKIKYYYLSVDSSQQAFTSDCVSVRKITFNFKYESYVTALKASVLDSTSKDYTTFVAFLDKAQNKSYKDASNTLDSILNDTSSMSPASRLDADVNEFGVSLQRYPVVSMKSSASVGGSSSANGRMKSLQDMLNTRVVV
ncbi:MAG TPA: hypothetical protein VFN35_09195, partial [Ktedonobacteraceae bacterium]|nr:hypothetical protein [Ktedonobacteraceae bacterium]